MNELISVIMPACNSGKFIAESIESVLAQSYENWELIIVDDESKDNTASIIKSYQSRDSRIKYLWQKNGKQGKARNYAIRESKGYYLAFIDSDDLWVIDKLKNQLDLIRDQKVELIFGYSFLLENQNKTEKKIGRGLGKYVGNSAIEFLLFQDAFIMSTVLVKKESVINVNSFIEDYDIQYCEDWHLWLKLAFEGYSFYTNGEVLSYYRISEISSTAVENKARIKLFLALINLNENYPKTKVLETEIVKRINQLVYHSTWIDEKLVSTFLEFLEKIHSKKLPSIIFRILFKVNTSLFRKFFLFIYD